MHKAPRFLYLSGGGTVSTPKDGWEDKGGEACEKGADVHEKSGLDPSDFFPV